MIALTVIFLSLVPIIAALVGWWETRETDFTQYTQIEREETWNFPPRWKGSPPQ